MADLPKQPQEEAKNDPTKTFLDKKKQQDMELFMKEGSGIPQQLIEKAKEKLAGFKDLKSGIDSKLMKVLDMLNEVRQIIKDNLYSEQRIEGYFIQDEAKYLTCLEL